MDRRAFLGGLILIPSLAEAAMYQPLTFGTPRTPTGGFIGLLQNADFNSTSDQAITITGLPGARKVRINAAAVVCKSGNASAAVGGVYPSPAKAGTAIVAASQTYTTLTDADTYINPTVNASTQLILSPNTIIYLSLTTPAGVAALCDVYILGQPIL